MEKRKIFFYGLKLFISIILILHFSFFLVTGVYLAHFKNNNPGTTAIMNYRKRGNRDSSPQHSLRSNCCLIKVSPPPGFIPLREIPADIISCVIFIEDFDFYMHQGIDFESIRFALKINKKLGYLAYGGSTLTQQLARTLFLNPEKNYIRKYLEILTALEMELILSKERILELYFNYAEWGKNLYGVNDASLFYYNRPLNELTDEQKLSLITILANPVGYTPSTFAENKILRSRHEALRVFFTMLKEIPPHFKSTIREKE